MSLREKINEQLNSALKNKNKTLVSTLRLILAGIKERDIANKTEGKKEEAKDVDIIKLLRRMKKQRQESADLYKKGGRQELLEVEESEIKIIETFLPKQFDEAQTKKICEEEIKTLGASSLKDMGKIIGSIKKKYSDSIDFSKVNTIIKGLLNQ
ncbi:GatB/YqeY domain-containing protein [Pelagibacteraceae bacterium]|nr:GatB/YqeY domain-containing protein [Pelagibacteraceae bacterium]